MPKNEFTCDCGCVDQRLVEQTLAQMPGPEMFDALAVFFKIMGDTTRCKLIFALRNNEMCVCDLANVVSMSKSSVSHQLSKMRRYGVVKCRRDGKEVYYSLDDRHVDEIFAITMKHIKHIGCGGEHEN